MRVVAWLVPSMPVTTISSRPAAWIACVAPMAGSSHAAHTALIEPTFGFASRMLSIDLRALSIGPGTCTCCSLSTLMAGFFFSCASSSTVRLSTPGCGRCVNTTSVPLSLIALNRCCVIDADIAVLSLVAFITMPEM